MPKFTRIYLQNSVPIQPKTSHILPKFWHVFGKPARGHLVAGRGAGALQACYVLRGGRRVDHLSVAPRCFPLFSSLHSFFFFAWRCLGGVRKDEGKDSTAASGVPGGGFCYDASTFLSESSSPGASASTSWEPCSSGRGSLSLG